MHGGQLGVSEDVCPADWIAPRLTGDFGAVSRTLPAGYPAYARICHPAERAGRFVDGSDRLADWPEVARTTRRQAHPLMQWHALVGSPDHLNMKGSLWPGGNPDRGNLVPEILEPLCVLLGKHTTTPDECFFCIWEGWGWVPDIFSADELRKPRVRLPSREYLLLGGPIATALNITAPYSGWRQSPNLFWPADHEWCAASEIDFDSTLVGGTTELVQAILQAPTLDSWPVGPDDSLAADADLINHVPEFED
jgi:hypothetical protein